MTRRTLVCWLALGCAVVGLIVLLFPSSQGIVGDRVWGPEEYAFRFCNWDGRPARGVELRVENASGTNFFFFPVVDYLPGRVPTSDRDGVLTFHTAPTTFLPLHLREEFDWSELKWEWKDLAPPPVYYCSFRLGGREVHRVRYNDLTNRGTSTVKRTWTWLSTDELQEKVFRGIEPWQVLPGDLRVFDLDGDGKIDQEEGYAARAAERAYERALGVLQGLYPASEELGFGLVGRTVTIDPPPGGRPAHRGGAPAA